MIGVLFGAGAGRTSLALEGIDSIHHGTGIVQLNCLGNNGKMTVKPTSGIYVTKDLTEVADLIAALQKQTYNCAAMTFLSTESVKVKVSSNMDWTLDGERQAGVSEVDVTCVHRGVQVIRPC